jgi:DNA invertase Pin-like site-specific DNA recombinase
MAKYVMYLRKSRADIELEAQGEVETLLRHEKHLLSLANKLRIHVTDIYREVVSGETIAARPVMQQLLTEVSESAWDGVLVMEIERLARGDTIDQGLVAQAFKISNTKIITPNKTFDPENEFDEEYFEFNLFMSRREYKTINRRIQRGRIASAKEGKFLGSTAPYGYDRIKIAGDKGFTLTIIPEQADIIKKIFEWYTIGDLQPDNTYLKLGATRIARKLNEIGIKPLVNDKWTKSSITDILKNPVYFGMIRWSYRKEKKVAKDSKISKVRRKSEEYIEVKGLHEPIISEATFKEVQTVIAKRGHAPVPGSSILKNPLTGLIYCSKCGTLMTRLAQNTKTPYDTIKCPNVYCDNISSPLYLVEEVVIDALRNWLINFKAKWESERFDMPYSKAIKDTEMVLEQLRSNHEKLNTQRDKLYTLLEQGVYSVDIFKERNKKIEEEGERLLSLINKTEIELSALAQQSNYNDIFIPMADNILTHYYDLPTAAAKNDALRDIVSSISYLKTEHNKKGNRDNTNFTISINPKVVDI